MLKFFLIFLSIFLITNNAQAHEHHPPHGGTLVEFGEEFAHLEFVFNAEQGILTAYSLDGEAEQPIRLKQKKIQLNIVLPFNGKTFPLSMNAVENPLTGESIGDTSEFQGQSDALKHSSSFNAVLSEVAIKGGDFKEVEFNYPAGNENHGKA